MEASDPPMRDQSDEASMEFSLLYYQNYSQNLTFFAIKIRFCIHLYCFSTIFVSPITKVA